MSSDFATVLDECLNRLKAGDSISACLNQHPEFAEDLRPLLEVAQFAAALRYTEPPRPQALAHGRQRFLAEAARLRQQRKVAKRSLSERVRDFLTPTVAGPAWGRAVAAVVVVLLVFASASGVVVRASEASLPGDRLYPVKQVSRQVQLLTTSNPVMREEKRVQIQAEEREEVRQAVEQGRVFIEDVEGPITEWQDGSLVLQDGLQIQVTDATKILGEPGVGRIAHVRVRSEDGRLLAEQIMIPQMVAMAAPTNTATPGLPTVTLTQVSPPTNTPEPPKPTPTKEIPNATATPKITDTPIPTSTPELGPNVHIFELRGLINAIGETTWVVADQEIRIESSTDIKGEPAIGRTAHVQANRQPDGSFVAVRIVVEMPTVPPKEFLSGIVTAKESETVILVNDQRIRLDDRTEITGDPEPGAFVDVEGIRESPTTVYAEKITVVQPPCLLVPIEGIINSIDTETGTWIVGGLTIRVDSNVTIEGATPAVGALAQVEACLAEDGTYSAERIFIISPPTPTDTPTVTATPTDTLTDIPTPTETPEPTSPQVTPTPTTGVSSQFTATPTAEPSPTRMISPPSDVTPTVTS
jgi:hypothetical protein